MNTTITVLYDTIRLEEKLLIESAKKNNVNLEMVDCKKLFVDLNEKITLMDQFYRDVLAITEICTQQRHWKVKVQKL